jgi:hypothetical protein
MDDTGSMAGVAPQVRDFLPSLINTLRSDLPGTSLGFGVGRFENYGNFTSGYAPDLRNVPFILNQPIIATETLGFETAISNALSRVAPGNGDFDNRQRVLRH